MDIPKIKQEQLVFLRNNDIFSVTERGVTTTTQEDTLTAEDTITIDATVKNIRSITIGGVDKYVGTDYTVDYKHATGCVVTFGSNQTGAYVVTYDFGSSDKIYPDFPRDDLTINSYPRIAVDVINVGMDALGIGGDSFISNVAITIVVYANNSDDLDSYINTIKDLYVTNAKNFYYLNFVSPTLIGPTINSADKKDEIMQKNLDIVGKFNIDG